MKPWAASLTAWRPRMTSRRGAITGTRWIGELNKKDHPAHDLFEAVKDQVAGVSCGCADVFGATEDAEKSGVDLIKDNPVPGTRGVGSFRKLATEGSTVLIF